MADPRSTAAQALTRITEVTRTLVHAQADFARESVDLARATLDPGVDASAAGRAWLDSMGRESARYWTAVGNLGLDAVGEAVTLGSRGLSRVMADTRAAATHHRDTADRARGTATPPSDRAIVLQGAVGEVVTGALDITNPHPRARRFTVSATPLAPDSGTGSTLAVTADPTSVTIPATTEQELRLTVDLGAARAGERYTGSVEISGGVEAVVAVTVLVRD